jgi:iron(III) transport system ATP-binding protein
VIDVDALVKTYPANGRRDRAPAVDGVTFSVKEGEFYTLLGPSGCGKSTTLRCLAGLERPDSGTIRLAGTEVASRTSFVPANQRDLGMVFQSYAVWPHMSVFENVAFPLREGRRRQSGGALRTTVQNALDLVGLGELGERSATQLSGGQQQRLALARAIVCEPAVLLLDEPLSNLDAKLRERMRSEIRLLQRRLGITTVFVTHDQSEALSMSDRVAVMNEGHIVAEGTPREIYYDSTHEFVARFIGSMNVIYGEIVGREDSGMACIDTGFGTVRCAAPVSETGSQRAAIAMRPEDVRLWPATGPDLRAGENVFRGRIQVDLFGGTYSDYSVEMANGETLRARVSSRLPFDTDAAIDVELPPEACRLLTLG